MHEDSNEQGWNNGLQKKEYPTLEGMADKDVVVVGGGLTGIISAYLLAKEGKTVAVIEKDEIGQGATHLTTAFLTQSVDTEFSDLIKTLGEKNAKMIVVSHGNAIDLVEKIIKEHNIDCDFERCSNFIYVNKPEDFKNLEEETTAVIKLGLNASASSEATKLGFPNGGFMEVKNQAKFHPLKFLYALAEEAEKLGVDIFEHTEIESLIQKEADSKVIVSAAGGALTSTWAISATYEPFHQPIKLFFDKGMYKSYVFELEVVDMRLEVGTYEDMENPYHYLRVDKEGENYRVVVGGEDHRQDIPVSEEKNFNVLLKYVESIIPEKNFIIKQKWSGPILEPIDGLAYIGKSTESNILYAFGFSGNGMTYAAISATLFVDIINNTKSPLQEIYAADRLPHWKAFMQKGNDYVGEFFGGAVKNVFGESKDLDPKIPQ